MDELTLIADALTGPSAEPTPAAVERGRAALLRAAATAPSPRPARVPRPVRRPLLWSLAGAAAATVVAVAVAMPGGGGPSTRGPSALVPGSGKTAPAGTPGGSALDGRSVLLAAADVVAHSPAASGAYWTQRSIDQRTWPVTGGYRVVARTLLETWVSRDGSRSWFGTQDLGAAPATAADLRKWRQAGSPETFTVPASSEGAAMTLSARRGALTAHPLLPHAPAVINFGGCSFSPAGSLALPAGGEALSARLRACSAAGEKIPLPGASGPKVLHPELWGGLVDLLTSWPVSPATRATAYRLLAAQAQVRSLGPATDPLGRAGTQLLVAEGAGIRLVVDTRTGQVLSGQKNPATPAGQSSAALGGAWTDQAPPAAAPRS
ncbi:CU044_5270 family protein [Peterkaempfera griseoplana]|uniref:CU044_5270 family protein n=1 Tax=Peterkaempfera griseoplana TaxID=66896 RepID=UPI0006E2725A|nr:CU044_5270 family protein [Peterkaempfera griseoplana]